MDSTIPQFLIDMALSTTPQQAFEQADALLLQAAELNLQTVQLQSQIDTIHERAEILTTTAAGLQAIAMQDRESIQYLLDSALETYRNNVAEYENTHRKAEKLHSLKARVEDGMVTVEELEVLIGKIVTSTSPNRSERSYAPEPESPPISLTAISSSPPSGLKRGRSTSDDEETEAAERAKRMKTEHSIGQEGLEAAEAYKKSDSNYEEASDMPILSDGSDSAAFKSDSLEHSAGQVIISAEDPNLTATSIGTAAAAIARTQDSDSPIDENPLSQSGTYSTAKTSVPDASSTGVALSPVFKATRSRKRKSKNGRKESKISEPEPTTKTAGKAKDKKEPKRKATEE